MKKGFTLVEILVTIFIFSLILTAITSTYSGIFRLLNANKTKIAALNLADEQIEIIRNLTYSQVGEISGIPNGLLPHTQDIMRNGVSFKVTTTIRNIDDPFDGTISGTPKDLAPADYKLAQIDVGCTTCQNYSPISLTTYVAPKNLEGASTNGALFIKVFDANGTPVDGADVHIVNASSTIIIDDITDSNGLLQIVDVPPGTNAYAITVSKNGYSTDKTYAKTVGNPNPTKPHATVAQQQVTQVSFAIDELSALNIQSITNVCAPTANANFVLSGAKTIGVNLLKYSASVSTNASGFLSLPSLEWDTYNLSLSGTTYDLLGTNPLLPTSLLPDSIQNMQIMLGPWNPSSLLVAVEDGTTNLPLTGATVNITKSGVTQTSATGRGFVKQTDWSGGAGQADMTNAAKYANNDGNIDATTVAGTLQLRKTGSTYVATGVLESSVFDMGTSTNFSQLTWNPTSQPSAAGASSTRFQIATNNDNTATTTWSYVGPNGSSTSFFTYANQNINTAQNQTRFIRYKAYLATASSTVTPTIADVLLTYTSACVPPGQAYFSGLASGTYSLNVSSAGYQTSSTTIAIGSTSTRQIILLNP